MALKPWIWRSRADPAEPGCGKIGGMGASGRREVLKYPQLPEPCGRPQCPFEFLQRALQIPARAHPMPAMPWN